MEAHGKLSDCETHWVEAQCIPGYKLTVSAGSQLGAGCELGKWVLRAFDGQSVLPISASCIRMPVLFCR